MNKIKVYNLSNLPTAPAESFLELQEDFKIPDSEKNMKLQMLIISRGFKYSFKAWRDPEGKLWIIDAHQRKQALITLRKRGFEVPDVPYELIHANDKRDAVQEIAAYNSEFAKRNSNTILFEKYNIGLDDLEQFNLKFSAEELDHDADKMNLFQERFEIVEDDIPELNTKSAFTKPGDVFLLGDHRLVCGDATSKDDVNLLMDGHQADLVITDPPYNVNYEGGTDDHLTIENDHMSDSQFEQFLLKSYSFLYQLMKDGAGIYVFHSDSEGYAFRKGFKQVGLKLAQCCIWVKNSMVMGRQDYQWQHEPVLYGWKPTGSHHWYSDRKQKTIWNFDRPLRNADHPTMKPVALIAYPMQNSSAPGQIVVDLFSGSGSMIMAAEQTGRRGFALELAPGFCDVIVKRYHAYQNSEDIRLIRGSEYWEWIQIKAELL